MLHAGNRLRPVSHDIPQAEHPPHRKVPDVLKGGLEGIDVGVDVAEDGEEAILGGLGGLGGAGAFFVGLGIGLVGASDLN